MKHLVNKAEWLSVEKAMPLVEHERKRGLVRMYPVESDKLFVAEFMDQVTGVLGDALMSYEGIGQ
jgi:hypothetical protein